MKQVELLLEHSLEGREDWRVRIYCDGRVEEYSDRYMTYEEGEFITHQQRPKWRPLTTLSAEEMERLIGVLRSSDFFEMPDSLGDRDRILDGTLVTWSASLDGKKKTVTALGSQATHHPALKLLGETFDLISASAFKRDAGKE
ncbi:MAG: hypothetical protein MUO76_24335 [Anaerolineaceae bacterium]|jgi:hypothetical protein|nr:hypothetical protein [Anaerolineaceae bacterium]